MRKTVSFRGLSWAPNHEHGEAQLACTPVDVRAASSAASCATAASAARCESCCGGPTAPPALGGCCRVRAAAVARRRLARATRARHHPPRVSCFVLRARASGGRAPLLPRPPPAGMSYDAMRFCHMMGYGAIDTTASSGVSPGSGAGRLVERAHEHPRAPQFVEEHLVWYVASHHITSRHVTPHHIIVHSISRRLSRSAWLVRCTTSHHSPPPDARRGAPGWYVAPHHITSRHSPSPDARRGAPGWYVASHHITSRHSPSPDARRGATPGAPSAAASSLSIVHRPRSSARARG